MKKFIAVMLFVSIGISNTFGQEKSKTISRLCEAQLRTYEQIFYKEFNRSETVDFDKMFKDTISLRVAECLSLDLALWGKQVEANVQKGRFRPYRLSFDKPSNKNYKVSFKAKRSYKKGFGNAKKDFINARKSKTLEQVAFDERYLLKYCNETIECFIKQKDKNLKKIAK